MREKFNLIKKIDFIQYMRIRFGRSTQASKLYPYKHSCMQIADSAKIMTNGPLHFNCGKIGKSRAESLLRLDEDSILTVNGFFSIFYGCDIVVFKNAELVLGSGFFNSGCEIRCGRSITIGDNVAIGRNCFIQDSDSHTIMDDEGNEMINSAPIVIGDHVWIGSNVTILKGITIGNGAIVGAGSIVTKNVPANAVVVGNPNRVLRENVRWK